MIGVPPTPGAPATGLPSTLAVQGSATPYPSIQAAKAAGATAGDVLSAPLAPATGPIAGKPESLVVVTVQSFWKNTTVQWVVGMIGTAFTGAFLIVFEPYVVGSKSWDTFTVAAAWTTFSHAWGIAIVGAVFLYLKTRDNNPVKGGS